MDIYADIQCSQAHLTFSRPDSDALIAQSLRATYISFSEKHYEQFN